jgi:heterodisulfide reductase subunit A-like polyferredoxin
MINFFIQKKNLYYEVQRDVEQVTEEDIRNIVTCELSAEKCLNSDIIFNPYSANVENMVSS